MVQPLPVTRRELSGRVRFRRSLTGAVVVQVETLTRQLCAWDATAAPRPPPHPDHPQACRPTVEEWRARELQRIARAWQETRAVSTWRDATAQDAIDGHLPPVPPFSGGAAGLTGRTRYRITWRGQVVLQVEIEARLGFRGGTPPYTFPLLPEDIGRKVHHWRDARACHFLGPALAGEG